MLIATLLLITQIIYFEQAPLAQHSKARAWLQTTCQILSCQLPLYRNLAEIKIPHSDFQRQTDQHYHLQFTLINEGHYPQNYPQLKLTLQNINNKNFATRIFPAKTYLNDSSLLKPNDLMALSLKIAQPTQTIGGYRLELL